MNPISEKPESDKLLVVAFNKKVWDGTSIALRRDVLSAWGLFLFCGWYIL